MKQWWLERFGSPKKAQRIQEVALPAPLPSHIAIKIKAAGLIAFTIIGTSAARGQTAVDRLQSLVETSARRLLIAQQVALAKWDSGTEVEDLPREA
jgi:chorismate mutase